MTNEERINMLEAALVECFDVAVPQAAPWTGTFSEKAEYAAKVLPEQLRGLLRLHAHQRSEARKIWMVSTGSYSSFTYVAAFSTEELADQFAKQNEKYLDDPEVYDYELDELKDPLAQNLRRFAVHIKPDGGTIIDIDDSCYEGWTARTLIRAYDNRSTLEPLEVTHYRIVCWAQDETAAAKVAMEFLMRHKASGQLVPGEPGYVCPDHGQECLQSPAQNTGQR